jgi:antitoxin PrlF
MLATLTSKGQITLPKPIRDQLALMPGAQLDFSVLPDGTLCARKPNTQASSVLGLLKRPGQRPLSVAEMDQAIAAEAIERNAQKRKK